MKFGNSDTYKNIKHMVCDEHRRLVELAKVYKDKIRTLPNGSPQWKGEYLYLAHREGPKVKFHYIGKQGSDRANETESQLAERDKLEDLLQRTKDGISDVRSIIKRCKMNEPEVNNVG